MIDVEPEHARRQRGIGQPGLWVLLGMILWACWLAVPYVVFGSMSYVRVHDCGDSVLPGLLAFNTYDGSPAHALWNRWGACGSDALCMVGNLRLAERLFSLLPGWLAYGVIMGLQRFVAGYFTYRLLRDSLQVGVLPALYSGLGWALFPQQSINFSWDGFTLYDGFGLPAFPFFLWVLHRLSGDLGWRAWAAAFGLGMLLAVVAQFAFAVFVLPCIALWFLVLTPRHSLRFWFVVATFVAGWLLATLPDAVPAMLVGPLSQRAHWPRESPLDVSGLVLGIELVGQSSVPCALAACGYLVSRPRNRQLARSLGCLLVCLLFLVSYRGLRSLLYSHLGVLAGFQFDRIYMFVPLIALAAGALGIQSIPATWRVSVTPGLLSGGIEVRWAMAVLAMLLVAKQSWAVARRIHGAMSTGATYAELYHQHELQDLAANGRQHQPFRVASVADKELHPAYVWAYGLESADGYLTLYPERFHSYWERVLGPLFAVDTNAHNYFKYWGNRVYLFAPSQGVSTGIGNVDFDARYRLELLSLANVRYVLSRKALSHPLLALRSRGWDGPLPRLKERVRDHLQGRSTAGGLFVYENIQWLPRFFAVSSYKVFASDADLLAALGQAPISELRSTAYISTSDAVRVGTVTNATVTAEVRLLRYGPNEVELEVDAAIPSLLVNTTTYSPFWKVEIDHSSSTVFPVDHTFQGVVVGPGKHRVVYRYEPVYAWWPK